jgi:hypothetical protein
MKIGFHKKEQFPIEIAPHPFPSRTPVTNTPAALFEVRAIFNTKLGLLFRGQDEFSLFVATGIAPFIKVSSY